MRNIIIILLLSLTACTNEQYTDNRPADQLRFIGLVRQYRDYVTASGTNEELRGQYRQKGVIEIKTHVVDTLELEFQSWEARVLDIITDPADLSFTTASFGMNLDGGPPNESSRYKSIVLTTRTDKSEAIHLQIKSLNVGNIVKIDGKFSTVRNTIDIDSYNDLSKSKNVLDNPEFRVEIGKVEKF